MITLSNEFKQEVLQVWNELRPEVGYCNGADVAEMVIDRMSLPEVDTLIDAYGYDAVRLAVAQLV